jgi:cell division protease FtsH
VQCLLDDADPLHKVSIIPRGPMGGATFSLPEKDRTMFTRKYCLALMQVCFGGRIAEKLFCDDISSGAQSDIDQATKVARQMIVTWGMSDTLGPISYGSDQGMNDQSYFFPSQRDYSEQTAQEIDREIKNLVDQTYKLAQTLIEANRDRLNDVAQALLKYETLDASEVKLIMDGESLDKPTVSELLAREQAKTPPPPPASKPSPDDQV